MLGEVINFVMGFQSSINGIPWDKILLGLVSALGGGGLWKGVESYLRYKKDSNTHDDKVQETIRGELRGQIDDLRKRLDSAEEEIKTWRQRHFELQEQYHELKREHQDALHEIKKLRQELKEYKN